MNFSIMMTTFMWLVWRDIRVLFKDCFNNFLDVIIFPLTWIFISGYVFPQHNFMFDFGSFMLVGIVVGMCVNSPGTYSGDLVADLQGQKNISYELTLPLPYWLVYLKFAAVYAIKSMITNIPSVPIGMVLLYTKFPFAQISIIKFILIYVLINIMFSFFSLCIAVWAPDMTAFGRFWIRWGWVLVTLGGFQFSWYMVYQSVPTMAYFILLNPFLYAYEGLRSALLGAPGYLPFTISFGMEILFTLIFAYIGLHLFKKRLDCV